MYKNLLLIPIALALYGCETASTTTATTTAPPTPVKAPVTQAVPPASQPVRLTATQELAKFCRVCVVDRGERMEEFLPSRLNLAHGGHTYKFCTENCRKSFEANPKKYAPKNSKSS